MCSMLSDCAGCKLEIMDDSDYIIGMMEVKRSSSDCGAFQRSTAFSILSFKNTELELKYSPGSDYR
jgi:hypothetical protein